MCLAPSRAAAEAALPRALHKQQHRCVSAAQILPCCSGQVSRARLLSRLQVCVAGLCIKQRDLLHAGYLAITLLLFRQRAVLMAAVPTGGGAVRGARLFLWLPAFNLLVMALTLLYQVGAAFCRQLFFAGLWSAAALHHARQMLCARLQL